MFSLAIGSRRIHLALSDLYFIETLPPHKLIVHTADSQYQFYGKLNQLEKEYPQMMRVHKAFLINPENVQEIDFSNKQIFFAEGIACSLSGSKVKAIKERIAKTPSD
ncbi:LytTR family DNA-binding domain-containing protein [Saccharibacillus brassicae]|uniref:LytTR family DNA-binding domain-containing protein n=1 Tax=Saccharibacillus brassicae TaxID=2583377 RepID=UPI0014787832|nr:LytTR family DNA-binding domain-containing protein [Saccharibacillus brassicae]